MEIFKKNRIELGFEISESSITTQNHHASYHSQHYYFQHVHSYHQLTQPFHSEVYNSRNGTLHSKNSLPPPPQFWDDHSILSTDAITILQMKPKISTFLPRIRDLLQMHSNLISTIDILIEVNRHLFFQVPGNIPWFSWVSRNGAVDVSIQMKLVAYICRMRLG